MNFRILAKVLGLLLVLNSLAMFSCGLFARLDVVDEDRSAMVALFVSGLITLAAGGLLVVLGRAKIERIPRREGVVIVGLGWILSTVFGALPFILCPPYLTWTSAVFESASGFTTTGSTAIDDLTLWPRGILLWRALSQWLGGVGILVLFIAVLSYLGVGTKSLFQNESSFQAGEASTARIRDTALMLWKIYLGLTLTCLLGLKVLGLSWFDSVAHAFTAVATGGFSPHNESIGYYSDWPNGLWIELWLTLFMALCSLNFLIYVLIFRRKWSRLRCEEDARWFLGVCIIGALAIALGRTFGGAGSFGEMLRESWFVVVSLASSTGFGTADYEVWPAWAHIFIILLMIPGGCSGSTAGGMKIGRLVVFIRSAFHEIVRAFRPNQVFRLTVNGNPLDAGARARTTLFVAFYLAIIAASSLVMGVLEASQDIDLETCLAASISMVSNIGPAFGEVGPTDNYSHLHGTTHLYLSGLMILGRLELFTILVLFVPAAWRRY